MALHIRVRYEAAWGKVIEVSKIVVCDVPHAKRSLRYALQVMNDILSQIIDAGYVELGKLRIEIESR